MSELDELMKLVTVQHRSRVLINHELLRQHGKWGEQHHKGTVWLAILTEEVGELAETVLREKLPKSIKHGDELESMAFDDELIHVAAVAISWLQARERARKRGWRGHPKLEPIDDPS